MHASALTDEFEYRTSRSTGAGGQHINTTESKVELLWHVERSRVLSATEKATLRQNLHKRINEHGYITLVEQSDRSQIRNKKLAATKMKRLIMAAIIPPVRRKPTVVPQAVRQANRLQKMRRAQIKKLRRSCLDSDADAY